MKPPRSFRRRALEGDELRFRRAMRWSAMPAGLLFVLLLTNFSFDPFRTALTSGLFSNFFDEQAISLLDGRLDVAPGETGIEAFIIDGKEYIYFPPGPAIIRMPLLAVSHWFVGQLTALSMLLAWSVLAAVLSRLLWEVRSRMRAGETLGRGELWAFGLLNFTVLGGSVVLYLGSLPWVYHEAYMWSIALTLGTVLSMLHLQRDPSRAHIIALGAWVTAAMLVRAPAGWALAVSTLGFAAWTLLRNRREAGARARVLGLVTAALVPLALGIGVNWAKFSHIYLFPLEKQVYSTVNDRRQQTLAENGGDLASTDFLPSTLTAYLRPDGIRITSVFPYVSAPEEPARSIGDAVLDQRYRTGSLPLMMSALFFLSLWGVAALLPPSGRARTAHMRWPVLATTMISGPVLMYGYIAYRYTSEFVPVMTLGAAIGLSDIVWRLSGAGVRIRRLAMAALVGTVLFNSYSNFATGVTAAALQQPGPSLDRYLRAQMRFDRTFGGGFDELLVRADDVPKESVTDQIRIIGGCDAAFLGTGDIYNPWQMLAAVEWDVLLEVGDVGATSEWVTLGTVGEGEDEFSFLAQVQRGRARGVAKRPDSALIGAWYPIGPDGKFRMSVLTSTKHVVYSLEPAMEDDKVTIPVVTFDGDVNRPRFFVPDATGSDNVRVTFERRSPSILCNQLMERLD